MIEDTIFRDNVVRDQIQSMQISLIRWRRVDTMSTAVSILFGLSSGLLAFSQGFFQLPILSFISGSFSIASLSVKEFGHHAYRQTKNYSQLINELLIANGEKPLPEIVIHSEGEKKI